MSDTEISSLRLLSRQILVEPIFEASHPILEIPETASQKYPCLGWVRMKGDTTEDINIWDIVLFQVNALDIPEQYSRLFYVMVRGERLYFDPEYESIVREFLKRAERRGEGLVIELEKFGGGLIEIRSKEVQDFGFEDFPYNRVKISYPTGLSVITLKNTMFYLMHESRVLAILESW